MRLFLDANVLFSAANEDSGIQRLVELLKKRNELLTSDYAMEEARRNIHIKRLAWKKGFSKVVEGLQIVPSIDAHIDLAIPPKDRPIITTALKVHCDILVTGDRKHFGNLFGTTVHGLLILSPLMLTNYLFGLNDTNGHS